MSMTDREAAELREENERFRRRETERILEQSREYQALRGDVPRVQGERALRILNEGLEAENAELRNRVSDLRKALVECDSLISLIRHRRNLDWGTRSLPEQWEVDQLIGRIRKVQEAR